MKKASKRIDDVSSLKKAKSLLFQLSDWDISLLMNICVWLLYPLSIQLGHKMFSLIFHSGSDVNYNYKDGECLLKMVYDSNLDHYNAHPLWPHRGFESDCDTQEYFNVQQKNIWEFRLSFAWLMGGALVSLLSIFIDPPKHSVFRYLPLAIISTGMTFITAHYQHDITHSCGNIQHHTNFQNDGENGSGIRTVPHGVLIPVVAAQLSVVYVVFESIKGCKYLRFWNYVRVFFITNCCWLLWSMLVVHPYIHSQHQSIYPWPLNLIFQDYYGHIQCHHVNGLCLGSIPFTGIFHDVLMKFHGNLYQHKLIERLTIEEAVANYVVDIILILLVVAYVVPVAFLTQYFVHEKDKAPSVPINDSSKIKATKQE